MNNNNENKSITNELAEANSEATWGETKSGKTWVPGVISGDLGPKGKVSAQLRGLSRVEREHIGEVPYGMQVEDSGKYVFIAIFSILLVLSAIVALVWWLAS